MEISFNSYAQEASAGDVKGILPKFRYQIKDILEIKEHEENVID